jgi:hypothetical protein
MPALNIIGSNSYHFCFVALLLVLLEEGVVNKFLYSGPVAWILLKAPI